MHAYLARIHLLNPRFAAIVNLAANDLLVTQAAERDAELARGESRDWIHGMRQAIKDTNAATDFPTTIGSPLLKCAVARVDSIVVERMKAPGFEALIPELMAHRPPEHAAT
jgi:amidase